MSGKHKKVKAVETVFEDDVEADEARKSFIAHVDEAAKMEGVSYLVICLSRVNDSYVASLMGVVANNKKARSLMRNVAKDFVDEN